MALKEEMEAQGNWLFKHRGTMPFLLIPLLAIAVMGGADPFVDVEPIESYWLILCVAISLLGLVVRALVIGYVPSTTSGRNTECQRASRVNKVGMYSIVRHPLYLGNLLMALGLAASTKVAWFIFAFILIYWVYYERIMIAEESYLRQKFGEEYDHWALCTPAFIPRFRQWQKPDMSFSWKMVLRREYPGVLVVTSGFLALDIFEEIIVEGGKKIHPGVESVFFLLLLLAAILRFMKKKTDLLDVAGR